MQTRAASGESFQTEPALKLKLCEPVPQDGFIHLTEDPSALETVFNTFYTAKEPWEWTCLVIDPAKLTSKVRTVVSLTMSGRPAASCVLVTSG